MARAWEYAPGVGLTWVRRGPPVPRAGELLVRVAASAVCRTDLHIVEGDLPPHKTPVTPGYQVVGEVVGLGEGVEGWRAGERAGIAWLRRSCRRCIYCGRGDENLCPDSRYTGWDADGGFAEFATVPADFAYRLPDGPPATTLAPLLCAGIIGYRAIKMTTGSLAIYGFGASAHLAAQVALAKGRPVHVVTRSAAAQRLARELGATVGPRSCSSGTTQVTQRTESAREELSRLRRDHLTDIPPLNYQRHLFQERVLRSVTANTRQDGREFLALAERIRVEITEYPLDRADRALADLANGRVRGTGVLTVEA